MSICRSISCVVVVATHDPELRKRFTGGPDHVVNFFKLITQELREIMAALGFKTINEMVGQSDFLEIRDDISHWKYKNLDLSPILYKEPASLYTGLYNSEEQDHGIEGILDWKLVKAAKPALESQENIRASFTIRNTDRTTGTLLSNEISKKYKGEGLPDETIHFKFTGTAGQSFG